MHNAHISVASQNLRRAASDLRIDKQNLLNEIDTAKRNATKHISDMKTQLQALDRQRQNLKDDPAQMSAINMQITNLKSTISQIEKDTNAFATNSQTQTTSLESKAIELESEANHLDTLT